MKKIISLIVVIITVVFAYCALWLYSAEVAKKEIDNFYNDSAENLNLFVFYGDKPVLSGFPGVPKLTYKGKLEIHNVVIDAKEIVISGFPIPHLPINITIDDEFTVRDNATKTLLRLDYLKGSVIAPKSLPKETSRNDVAKWQKDVGTIDLKSLETAIEGAKLEISGPIGLDEELQPTVNLKTRIKNHRQIINYFVAEGKIRTFEAGMISGYLDSRLEEDNLDDPDILDEENLSTNKYLEIYIIIRDRRLSIGPVRLIKFPRIAWKE